MVAVIKKNRFIFRIKNSEKNLIIGAVTVNSLLSIICALHILLGPAQIPSAGGSPQEGIDGIPGPDPDPRATAAVLGQEPNCRQSGNLHQSG